MSVGREEARSVDASASVDGRAVVLTDGPAAPGIPREHRFARSRPFRLAKGATDGGSAPQMDGLGRDDVAFRVWDFWVRRSWMLWVLAVLVLVLDQGTKSIIVGWLDWGESWPVEGFLRLTHARNTGTAFSLFQGHSNILSFVAIFAVAVLLWVYATTGAKSFVLRFALGLQLGGALGNLLDRLRLGYVTDFVDVGPWPIFNVADSAISVGMVLMVLYFVTAKDERAAEDSVATAVEPVGGGCRHCAEAMRFGTLNRMIDVDTESDIRT